MMSRVGMISPGPEEGENTLSRKSSVLTGLKIRLRFCG